MKILLFVLLLYAAVKLTNPQCSTATVDMSLVQQSGDEGDSLILNFGLECPVAENIFTISLSYSHKETEVTDYSGPATVNIPTGVTFFSTTLSLSEDNIVEIDERFCVVIDSVGSTAVPTAGALVTLDTVAEELTTTVTIEDDDTATVSIFSDTAVNEGTGADSTATVTLGWSSLFEDPGFTVGLSYDLTTGSLETGDLTTGAVSYTLSLSGTSSIEIPIVIHEDAVVEDDEFLTISITDASEPNGYARTDAIYVDPALDEVVVTVLDDDILSVSFSVDQSATEDSSVEVAFLFSNQVEDADTFSFSYTVLSSDAESIDYNLLGGLASPPIVVPTSTSDLTYTILFVDDNKAEDDETVLLSLTSFLESGLIYRTGAITGGSKLTFAATIQDNDNAELTLSPTSYTVSETMDYTQTILLDRQIEDDGYSVTLNLIADTAAGGSDFSPSGLSTYAIPTCVDTFEVVVNIIDDDLVEDWESFSVSIVGTSTPVGFRADVLDIGTDSLASVTIEDDNTATIGIRSIGTFTESAGSTGTITLTVTGMLQAGDVYTATVSLTDGDTDGGDDYTGDSFEVTLSSPADTATVEIPIVNNNNFEDYETFTAAISSVSPPSTFKSGGSGDSFVINTQENNLPGEIEDDDTVTFSFASTTQTVNEGTSVTVTICSDNVFDANNDYSYTLSFDYLNSELDTTGTYIDYVEVSTFIVPSATNKYSFSFTVSGDSWVEDDESVTLSFNSFIYPHKRTSGVFFDSASSTSVITVDDDDTAEISMVSSTLQITEGDSLDVTGTISLQIDAIILIPGFSVTLTWIDDTAIDGAGDYDDYNSGSTVVAVETATNTQEISYEVVSNLIVEDHESFTVSLSTVTPPSLNRDDNPVSISAPSSTTVVTINDDDTGTASCPERAVVEMSSGVFTSVQLPEPVTGPQITFIDASGDPVSQNNFMVGITTAVRRNDESLCLQNIIIIDTSPPEVTSCSEDIIRELKLGEKNISVDWREPSASDMEGGPVTVVSTHKSGDLFTKGATTVRYTFCDSSNNLAYCTFTVIVTAESKEDETIIDDVPVIKDCYSNSQIVEVEEGQREYNVTLQLPPTIDMTSSSPVKEENFTVVLGFNELLYNFSADGNRETCLLQILVAATNTSQKTAVFDDCPRSITVNTTDITNFSEVFWTEPVVRSPATVNRSPLPDDTFFEEITVTYTAEVNGIVTDKCSIIVNIADVTPPVILNCPSGINATLCRGARTVHWFEPYAVDNSNRPVHVVQTHEPLKTPFKTGTTRVTYIFGDDSENFAACHFDVNVRKSQNCRPFSPWWLLIIILILTVAVIILILICAVCLSCKKDAKDGNTQDYQEVDELELRKN